MNPQESEPISKESGAPPAEAANGAADKAGPLNGADIPAAAELIGDIDAYQRRMEREWDNAKNVYQSRISEIMDDFLKKGVDESAPLGNGASSHKTEAAPEGIESIVARVTSELRAMESRSRKAPPAPAPALLTGPAARFSLWKRASAAGFALLLIAAATAGLRMPEWTPLPYARAGGIVVSGGKIFIADWFRKTLYVHAAKRGAPITSVEALPVGLVAGVLPGASEFYTVDGLSGEILRHATTPDHQILERYPAPDAEPAALTRDGDDLWLAGLESRKIFRLRADDPGEIRDRFDLPLAHVTSLQMRENRLWALDGKSREVTVFRLQKPLKTLATFDLDPFLRGATPTGMSLSGANAWIVTENPSAILRLPLKKLKKSKSSDF